jgi:hypothetical protein
MAEQKLVRDDAKERYVSYAFLRQSGIQHGNLKVDLQNDLPPETITIPRIVSRRCIFWTSIARL